MRTLFAFLIVIATAATASGQVRTRVDSVIIQVQTEYAHNDSLILRLQDRQKFLQGYYARLLDERAEATRDSAENRKVKQKDTKK